MEDDPWRNGVVGAEAGQGRDAEVGRGTHVYAFVAYVLYVYVFRLISFRGAWVSCRQAAVGIGTRVATQRGSGVLALERQRRRARRPLTALPPSCLAPLLPSPRPASPLSLPPRLLACSRPLLACSLSPLVGPFSLLPSRSSSSIWLA